MKKSLVLALLLMGFTGILAQVILIRELLVTFCGNELSIGIILANWLILEAAGSFFLGRVGNKIGRSIKSYITLQFAIAVLLPIAVVGARVVKNMLGIPPGEMVGLFPIFYSSLLLLAPLSLADGETTYKSRKEFETSVIELLTGTECSVTVEPEMYEGSIQDRVVAINARS